MFSPLTMQRSAPSSSRRPGSRSSTARRPASPKTSARKRSLSSDQRRRGPELDRDVVAGVVRVPGERLLLDAREVDDAAEPRRSADHGLADGQRRIRVQLCQRDDERRCVLRLDVDPRAVVLAADDVRRDADDGPVHRRVDARAGRGADVERRGRAAAELVPGRMAAAAAEHPVEHPRDETLVPLAADRRERHRPVLRRVVADRRDASCATGICSRTAPCTATTCGDGLVCAFAVRSGTASGVMRGAPPPKAVRISATMSTIARTTRSAKFRALRAARTSRRSTRRPEWGERTACLGSP